MLLPGAAGFVRPATTVVNLSYYVFPALALLAQLVPSADWTALQQHGRWLIEQARFGRWTLPPDWLQLGRDGHRAGAGAALAAAVFLRRHPGAAVSGLGRD